MSNKKGTKKGTGENKAHPIHEPTLQAVLLIDTYNLYFSPLSIEYPPSLFPVANEPILSYTLHFLRRAGIQELFIVGRHCPKELDDFIKNFPLIEKGSQLNVQLIFSESCDSVGTCLKQVYLSQLIHSNFVLLHGCIISNVDLLGIMKEHKERAKKNTGSMMTMVFQRGSPEQRSRTQENDLALMISKNEKQLLFYQRTGYRSKVKFPLDKILSHSSVKIHYDLLESALYICSPQVPQLFYENFDYQTIEDFIDGILIDEELLSNQIHTHILGGRCYLSSARTPLAYHCINTDVMERWSFPYVPDTNLMQSPSDQYEYSRRNIYLGAGVTLERGSRLEENVVVGKSCHIHAGAYVTCSVLGENVVIGENVKVEDSYIWGNVTIHADCTILGCIIASDVTINRQCRIGPSSFISRGITIGPEVCLPSGARLMKQVELIDTPEEQGSDNTFEHSLSHEAISLGTDTAAVNLKLIDSTSKETILSEETVWGVSRPSIVIVIRPDTPEIIATLIDQEDSFYRDLLEIIRYGISNKVSVEDIQMEIKSRRHASVIPMEEIGIYVMRVVLEGPAQPVTSPQELLDYIKTVITHIVRVFETHFCDEDQQIELINTMETVAIGNRLVFPIFQHILYHLYDEEIVSQDAILSWHSSEYESEKRTNLRRSVDTIVEWLNTAEVESDSSD